MCGKEIASVCVLNFTWACYFHNTVKDRLLPPQNCKTEPSSERGCHCPVKHQKSSAGAGVRLANYIETDRLQEEERIENWRFQMRLHADSTSATILVQKTNKQANKNWNTPWKVAGNIISILFLRTPSLYSARSVWCPPLWFHNCLVQLICVVFFFFDSAQNLVAQVHVGEENKTKRHRMTDTWK